MRGNRAEAGGCSQRGSCWKEQKLRCKKGTLASSLCNSCSNAPEPRPKAKAKGVPKCSRSQPECGDSYCPFPHSGHIRKSESKKAATASRRDSYKPEACVQDGKRARRRRYSEYRRFPVVCRWQQMMNASMGGDRSTIDVIAVALSSYGDGSGNVGPMAAGCRAQRAQPGSTRIFFT